MKKIKKIIDLAVCLGAFMLLAAGCNDELNVYQSYAFRLETMPVQKRIMQGETAEIRCYLHREGNYEQARYFIRYFQPDGKGELRMDDGTVFLPNDLYPLERMTFRLYYTSHCTDQQVIDIYIEDNFGQVASASFSWQNESSEAEKPTANNLQ